MWKLKEVPWCDNLGKVWYRDMRTGECEWLSFLRVYKHSYSNFSQRKSSPHPCWMSVSQNLSPILFVACFVYLLPTATPRAAPLASNWAQFRQSFPTPLEKNERLEAWEEIWDGSANVIHQLCCFPFLHPNTGWARRHFNHKNGGLFSHT
jgi:hypothetical protein